MLNQVELIGRLGNDPEFRTLNSGDRVCNIRLATTETWKNDAGERKERTTWHTVEVFGKGKVNAIEKCLRKGSLVHIIGQLRYDEYEIPHMLEAFMAGDRGFRKGGAGKAAPPKPS